MRLPVVLILTALAVGVPASVSAQTNGPLSEASLSSADRAAIAGILDALVTQKGDALNQLIVNKLNSPGIDAQAVARAVKKAAGSNLPSFQSVLVQSCLSGGEKYCKLASIQAPDPQESDVKTASTGSGDGGSGGGGGFGGTPQTNGGHYGGGSTGGSLFNAGALTQDFQNFGQSFSARSGSGGTTTFAASTVSVPGPIAGAGLPVLIMALSWFIWRRRRNSIANTAPMPKRCA